MPSSNTLRKRVTDRVQFNFGLIPRFVGEEFERLATARAMTRREYLYDLLRRDGANIPPYAQMDGRRK